MNPQISAPANAIPDSPFVKMLEIEYCMSNLHTQYAQVVDAPVCQKADEWPLSLTMRDCDGVL
jgi:hypothetical protein